jgi:chitodextrinase
MFMLPRKTDLLVPVFALVFAACGGPSSDSSDSSNADAIRPSAPTGVTAAAAGSSVINLSWNASTDDVGVTGYVVSRAGTPVATPVTTSYVDTGLSAGTTYNYTVAAQDATGNMSLNSTSASATTTGTGTGTGDTTRPSTPTGLTAAAAAGAPAIDLSWNASTDNVGVTGYVVRRNGSPVATPVAARYADTGLFDGTTYRYSVAALDAAGNSSFLSTVASATTAGTPPPPPPTGVIPSTLGWYSIPNTQLRSVCAAAQGFAVGGSSGCPAITDAWSGGAFDTSRNRLLIWGGGHGDYAGNEVYALELDTLILRRLNDPSIPVRDGCGSNGGTYAYGKPAARHSYTNLAYLPNQDAMFFFGGSPYACGGILGDTWLFDFSNLSWAKKSGTNGPGPNIGSSFSVAAAYDPNTGLVYERAGSDLFSYNPATDVWTKRSSSSNGMSDYKNGVIDPVRKKYFLYENGFTTLYWYDISSPTALVPRQSGQTTGCSGFIGNYSAGIAYDPIQDRIIGWNGGNTIYILNPDTLSCTTVIHSGGPSDLPNGTFGRFRYSPSLNVFVVCNSVDVNCYALRLTPP